jgi:esterase/lipase superfamily enzyme
MIQEFVGTHLNKMDIVTLTALLAPHLPTLMKLGGKAAESAASKIGTDTWEAAKKIWDKLSPTVEKKEATKEAATDLANNPEDQDLQAALRVQLKKLLEQDKELEDAIAKILADASPEVIAGVQITQNVTGDANQIIGQVTDGKVFGHGTVFYDGDRTSHKNNRPSHKKNSMVQKGLENVQIGGYLTVNIAQSIDNEANEEKSRNTKDQTNYADKGISIENQTSTIEIPVFFATDRRQLDTASVKTFYGGKRNLSGQLECGLAKVSIPEDHRMGEIERPKWWRLELWEDPQKHIVLTDIEVMKKNFFMNTLRKSVQKSSEPAILIFIHGYNTSFEDAAIRTAQITYDLQFPGQAVFYSWPSEAKLELYTSDENNIEWTIPHFEGFLNLLLTSVGANMVNAIAHSMGNRILTRAVHRLDYADLPENSAKLRNVIFAAPDIDADTFKQFAKNFQEKAERLTLYASSNDKALAASKLVHGGYPRAGDSGDNLVVVDGLDTIDASSVDTSLLGHSYFGDNRSIISDIFYLIQHNLPPNSRSGLKPKMIQNLCYWLFQP